MSRPHAKGILSILTKLVDALETAQGRAPLPELDSESPESLKAYGRALQARMRTTPTTTGPGANAIPFVDYSGGLESCHCDDCNECKATAN